jgi:nitroreductase
MEFKDIVRTRQSVRRYTSQCVPEETIQELLEIIGLSVSAINLQPWKIKVIADQETRDKVFPATFGMTHARDCSHLLVLCADTDYPAIIARLGRLLEGAGTPADERERILGMATMVSERMTPEQRLKWSQEQVHIALGNAVNGAHSLGLGACPMTAFKPDEVASILDLPPSLVPTAMVSVGYAAEEPRPKLRHPVSEIVI